MKKIVLMAFAAAMFISCSDDDASVTTNPDENENEIEVTLPGTWKLTAYTAVAAVDYDGDGVATNDVLAEASCLEGIQLKFNEDGTLEYTSKNLGFNGNTNAFLGCSTPDVMPGTYTVTGNEIAIAAHSTESSDTVSFTVTKSGNKLTNSWTGFMAGSDEFTKQE